MDLEISEGAKASPEDSGNWWPWRVLLAAAIWLLDEPGATDSESETVFWKP
jgi:hypothetical protein